MGSSYIPVKQFIDPSSNHAASFDISLQIKSMFVIRHHAHMAHATMRGMVTCVVVIMAIRGCSVTVGHSFI